MGDEPRVPPVVRTIAYLVGIVGALGIAPVGLALDLPVVTAVGSALGGVGSAIAFGYRPTAS